MANTLDTQMQQYTIVKDNMKPMRWSRTEKGKQKRREAQKEGVDKTPFNDGCRELKQSDDSNVGYITNALNKDALLGNGMRIRRLTPVECARLQGFPDDWHSVRENKKYKGEIDLCEGNVKLIIVKDKSLIGNSACVLCTIKGLRERVILNKGYIQKNIKINAQFVVQRLNGVQKVIAQDITKCNDFMEILCIKIGKENFQQTNLHHGDMLKGKAKEQNTEILWKITWVENLSQENLSIILMAIKQTIQLITCSFVTVESINFYIDNLKESVSNLYQLELSSLEMGHTTLISDNVAYRCYGNAVSVPVVKAIAERLK